jgi:diadenosine tetraphosphate (Ap4A) HIT family hydrolase
MTPLHPQLQQDCLLLGHFPLCRLLLMRDANYPWFILVPDRPEISEIYQLDPADRQQLMRESCHLSMVLAQQFQAHKMNVAALGNLVPQLHIHHIVRYRHDPAWPAPVWGKVPARPYSPEGLAELLGRLSGALGEGFVLERAVTSGAIA